MPNETRPRVARRRTTKAALPAEDQLSLFDEDDTFDQPLDPRVVDPGGTPLPPVRRPATPAPTVPTVQVASGESTPPAPPPALSVVSSIDTAETGARHRSSLRLTTHI